ncbi:melanoma-associated antigen B16 [Oryctolagus cuniculus]|nr:melanoma-associated antigen B16 [Oryctolagus cuniculus]
MSQDQERLQYAHYQQLHSFSESQDLEVSQISQALEVTFLSSSHSIMSDNMKEASPSKKTSTPDSPQSFCSSSIANAVTSSNKPDEISSSQDEEDVPSISQAVSDPENVPMDALDKKVALLVNFMLLKYQTKESIRKEDMLKMVIREDEDHFSEIFLRATERMEMIFGLDVKEVDSISHCYGLFIKLGLTYDGMLGEDSQPKTGLLILILGVIFMKGNRATEEEIWEVLNLMGIYSGRKHFIFGDVKKFITKELVKEKYLEYRKVANNDIAQYEFLWGPRTYAETSKMRVLEFLAKLHGTDLSAFPSQYKEALKDEGERAQARNSIRDDSTSMGIASSAAVSSNFSRI